MNRVSFKALSVVLLIGTLFAAVSFAADHNHQAMGAEQLVIGKQGDITLDKPTKVGDAVLQPGNYVVQHSVVGPGHVFSFVQITPEVELVVGKSGTGQAVTVKCGIERLQSKVKKTTITTVPDGAGRRVTRIEIKGENVAHTL